MSPHLLDDRATRLFVGLAHNAATPVEYFRLPIGRTVVMGAQVRF